MISKNKKMLVWGIIPVSFIIIFMSICLVVMLILGGGRVTINACEVVVDKDTEIEAGTNNINIKNTEKEFIEKVAKACESDEYNIMPSLTISQAILESAWGTSYYASTRNNYFGIGAYDSNPDNAFSFNNIEECVTYHDKILSAPPYGSGSSTGIEGFYSWNDELKKGLKPYASDPAYYEKLKKIVKKYNLTKYDNKKLANKITSTNKQIVRKKSNLKSHQENECIETEPLSAKAVSMNIDINKKPYRVDGGNPFAPNYIGQCTWFAWARFFEWYGIDSGARGDGKTNVNQIINSHSDLFEKTSDFSKLKNKSIFSCSKGGSAISNAGHVGCIEKVDLNKKELVVSEGNVNGKKFAVNTWSFSAFKKRYPNGLVFAVPKEEK